MTKKTVVIPLVVLLAVLAVVVGYIWHNADNARKNGLLPVSGNIEVTDVELSFRIAGWVKRRPVDEGYMIKPGQLIAELDDRELRDQVNMNQAQLAVAQAAAGQAKAEADFRARDYLRVKELRKRNAASTQELDLAGMTQNTAQEALNLALARINEAAAALAAENTRLSYLTLASPVQGVVLSKNVEAGEYVLPGTPVVTVADLRYVYLRAYVNETDLGRVNLGQSVRVTTDTYPGKVHMGRISFIADEAEFTPKNVQTQKERVKLVYRIKVDIENPKLELKPGMPADGEIVLE